MVPPTSAPTSPPMQPLPSAIDAPTLELRLGQLLHHESNTIREAEEALRKALTKPAVICDLFARLQVSPHTQIRQLAAVLMRRRIGAHWTKLEKPVRQQLQVAVLGRLAHEPERLVRRSMSSVVSVVARHALPKGEWPELFGFLLQCSQSGLAEHRELSMLLLASLMESETVVDTALRPHFSLLRDTLATMLADAESATVRRAALKAVGAWAFAIIEDDDVAILKPLISPMLELARSAALSVGAGGASDEDSLVLALGILYDLLEASTSLVLASLPAILSLATDAAVASAMEPETRCAALNLIAAAVGTQVREGPPSSRAGQGATPAPPHVRLPSTALGALAERRPSTADAHRSARPSSSSSSFRRWSAGSSRRSSTP